MSGYSEAALTRFNLSQGRIRGGEIRGYSSLVDDKHVSMSLDEFYAIGCEMSRLRGTVTAQASTLSDVQAALDGCG